MDVVEIDAFVTVEIKFEEGVVAALVVDNIETKVALFTDESDETIPACWELVRTDVIVPDIVTVTITW